MASVQIYTKSWCGYCHRAKALLDRKNVRYDEIDVTSDREREREMVRLSGRTTVPQIFIDLQPIGGCDELHALERSGRLDPLLRAG
jgi:glutaredoxin 3